MIWRVLSCLAAVVMLAAPSPAQVSGLPSRTIGVVPMVEHWRFVDALYQFNGRTDSLRVDAVTQTSVPWSIAVPVGGRFTVDASGAFVSGSVTARSTTGETDPVTYTLSGQTDTRLRLVTRVSGDNVLLTFGATLPTGRKSLDAEQFAALRVLAAPALGLGPTAAGSAPGVTGGLVLTRQALGWALALGGTYEVRRGYSPVAGITTGVAAPDYHPGNVAHLSIAADRLVGSSAMTFAVATDFYGDDELTITAPDQPPAAIGIALGPTVTTSWSLRLASPIANEATVYATDFYRSAFSRNGVTVPGTSGHQVDAGLHSVLPIGGPVGALLDIEGRYQTGLEVDNSIATVGLWSTGAAFGLQFGGPQFSVTPLVRGRYAIFGTDDRLANGLYLAGALSIAARF